ncbi:MAG: pyrroloquinoline quinone biosynthesis protein PqqE [Hyphomicrobiaceae bacterium]
MNETAPIKSAAEDETLCPRSPVGLLAELTHRCPLQCAYCSNPLEMERVNQEMTTEQWKNVLTQAGEMGILQLHLSGGEPTARKDLEEIVEAAATAGLYTNLITAGVLLKKERLSELQKRGLDHVQLSIQDADTANAERIGGYKGASAKKLEVTKWVHELEMPLTINAPLHRQNIENLEAIIQYAIDVGAGRLEVAHIQYYAWALKNRAALMPTREAFMKTAKIVDEARERLKGILVIDFVVPDYYAKYPKPCMGGWGQGIMNITPSGKVLPCHAAESLPGLKFDNVNDRPLSEIWLEGQAFNKYRGTDWMPELCRSCDRRDIDYGGCRCQAYALTGDAANTDPACSKSPLHTDWAKVAEEESHKPAPEFIYRRMGGAK